MSQSPALSPAIIARQYWMSVLAKAPAAALEKAWLDLPGRPDHTVLRAPEIGSALVRGRAGGTGAPFNLGEMTVTRCALVVDGRTGFSYVAGRDRRHAELAAAFDALLQDEVRRGDLMRTVIEPLAQAQAAARAEASCKAASSRVTFFTLARGAE